MPMADIPPLFSSKRYRKKRRTVGDKEKTNAYMKEYRKKGPDRNRKNITMLTRKNIELGNDHLPQVNCTMKQFPVM